jgi:hypothetical protein
VVKDGVVFVVGGLEEGDEVVGEEDVIGAEEEEGKEEDDCSVDGLVGWIVNNGAAVEGDRDGDKDILELTVEVVSFPVKDAALLLPVVVVDPMPRLLFSLVSTTTDIVTTTKIIPTSPPIHPLLCFHVAKKQRHLLLFLLWLLLISSKSHDMP